MLEVSLSVKTCDKCGKRMRKGAKTIIITEGVIAKANGELDFEGSGVRYACHFSCWDNVEHDPYDKPW